MSDLTLRIVWPIYDTFMSDADAIAAAWFELPELAEERQVTVVDRPRMTVVQLDGDQQQTFRASRAVVCDAPVIKRTAAAGRDT